MTISATTQGLRMGVATSSSRPTVPFDGQVISETDTDQLKVYNGTSWIGVGGLVPIAPTSVAVGSGSGSTSVLGQVTVTAASSVSLNGVFTATYNNYFVNLNLLAGTGTPIPTFRVRSAGTDLTSSTYQYAAGYANATTLAWLQGNYSATSIFLNQIRTNLGMHLLNINSPFLAQNTAVTINTIGNDFQFGGGSVQNTTSYDGFTITTPSSTLTGTISVYGYNQ